MLESKLKSKYQTFVLRPLLNISWIQKRSPSTFTMLGILSGICILFFLPNHHPFIALSCLMFSGLCDTIDGALARYLKTSTPIGAAFDITADRLVELSVILALFLVDPQSRGFFSLLMLGSILLCITSFLVVGIFSQNETEKSFYYSPGIIERAEAFAFFSLMMLFPTFFSSLSFIFTTLVALTTIVRLHQFVKNFS